MFMLILILKDTSDSNYHQLFEDILDENLGTNLKPRVESKLNELSRHSTPIYQMLERVENKVMIRA